MESMPAPASPVTVGVDTHLDTHVAAVIDQTGRLLDTQGFAASTHGYVALVTWAEGSGRWSASGSKGPAPWGRPDPVRARLWAGGGRGGPAGAQHPPAPGQVRPDRRPGRRPSDPGRGGDRSPKTREARSR